MVLCALFPTEPLRADLPSEGMRLVSATVPVPAHAISSLQTATEVSSCKNGVTNVKSRKANLEPFEQIVGCRRDYLDRCLQRYLHQYCQQLVRSACQPYLVQTSTLRQCSKHCPRSFLITGTPEVSRNSSFPWEPPAVSFNIETTSKHKVQSTKHESFSSIQTA